MRSMRMVTAHLCLLAGLIVAGELEESEGVRNLSVTGKMEFEVAEMLRARTTAGMQDNPARSQTVHQIWFGRTIGTLNFEAKPVEKFAVRAGFEFRQYMTALPYQFVNRDRYFGAYYWNSFYMREGQGIFSFVKNEKLSFDAAFGYMPYKYNPDVRDLGEFLFRSGTYPLYLLGEFERPFARLLGLRTTLSYQGEIVGAGIDLLGLTEHEIRPFNDISCAAITRVNLFKILEIGGGVDFAHLIPVDNRITTSDDRNNNRFARDSSVESIDTFTVPYDTTWQYSNYGFYTFKGTKLMARGTLDLVELAGAVRSILTDGDRTSIVNEIRKFTGESGFKLYGEYAIIGLANYPGNNRTVSSSAAYNPTGYRSIKERSPWMVGFTLPMWKLLDVCSFELERFPSYFRDNYFRVIVNGLPLPVDPREQSQITNNAGTEYDSSTYVPRWNWSLYMKKQIVRNFGMVCQIGRNHQRWDYNPNAGAFKDFEAAMVRPDQWGWHFSGVFSF